MRARLASLLVLAAMTATATAAPLPKAGTTIFSDACASQGGDFQGFRVTIVRQAGPLKITVEFNDSGPDGRDVARNVQFDQASGKLSFQFKGDLPHAFSGTVSATSLQGSFDGRKLSLPRIKAVPKSLPDCTP